MMGGCCVSAAMLIPLLLCLPCGPVVAPAKCTCGQDVSLQLVVAVLCPKGIHVSPLGKPFLLQFSFPHRLYTFQLHNSEWQYSGSPPLILLSVAKSCLTLCNPVDCSPSGSSVHGISQARILEWVAISCATGSSRSRDQTCISSIGRWILYH